MKSVRIVQCLLLEYVRFRQSSFYSKTRLVFVNMISFVPLAVSSFGETRQVHRHLQEGTVWIEERNAGKESEHRLQYLSTICGEMLSPWQLHWLENWSILPICLQKWWALLIKVSELSQKKRGQETQIINIINSPINPRTKPFQRLQTLKIITILAPGNVINLLCIDRSHVRSL